jgi:hypothetical protein
MCLLVSASASAQVPNEPAVKKDMTFAIDAWTLQGERFEELRIMGSLLKKLSEDKYEAVEAGIVHEVALGSATVKAKKGGESRQLAQYSAKMVVKTIPLLAQYLIDSIGEFHQLTEGDFNLLSVTAHHVDQLMIVATQLTLLPNGEFEQGPLIIYDLDLEKAIMTSGGVTRSLDPAEAGILFGHVVAVSGYAINVLKECQKPSVQTNYAN